jgi:hypothetical protein
MLTRRTVMLAKVEGTYGTDPTPTAASNAILVNDVNLKIAGEVLERDFYKSSLSRLAFARGLKHAEISFGTELKGTGTRGSLPATGWEGTLFRGCGFAETVVASTRVAYAPVSTGFEGVTLYVYKDGIFHKCTGCMGEKVELNFETGKYPTAKWSFKGIYNTAVDATPSTQTFNATVPPTCLSGGLTVISSANTLSTAAVVEKVQIVIDNTLAMRKSINEATGILGWTITDRKISGSFDPETILEATYPFWGKWSMAVQHALNLGPIGSTSGNIITNTAPAIQFRDIDYGERNGQMIYQIPFDMAMSAGDDEYVITFT